MDRETTIKQDLIVRPFEARLVDDKLRAKVEYFQKLLAQKREKKLFRKTKRRSINEQ